MTPATMRRLDRWFGDWLCRLLAFLQRQQQDAKVPSRKVLCIGLAEMGSIVLAAPAIRRLEQRGWEAFFLTFATHRRVPAVAGAVEQARVRVLRTGNIFALLLDIGKLLLWTRRNGISTVIDLEPCMFFSALLGLASGARNRLGFAHDGARWQARNRLYTLPLAYAPDRHMAESFAALVALLEPATVRPELVECQHRHGGDGATTAIRMVLGQRFPDFTPTCQRIVFLNPNAGDAIPQRRWSAQNFVELAARILECYPDTRIALIGSHADQGDCAAICGAIAAQLPVSRCANLAGMFDIDELPVLFSLGHLLVSNDSGPAHLAALTCLPIIVLFGPETPDLYRPLGNAVPIYAALPCSPCITPQNLRATTCRDNRCMQAISVERVFAAASQLLTIPYEYREPAAREMAA